MSNMHTRLNRQHDCKNLEIRSIYHNYYKLYNVTSFAVNIDCSSDIICHSAFCCCVVWKNNWEETTFELQTQKTADTGNLRKKQINQLTRSSSKKPNTSWKIALQSAVFKRAFQVSVTLMQYPTRIDLCFALQNCTNMPKISLKNSI